MRPLRSNKELFVPKQTESLVTLESTHSLPQGRVGDFFLRGEGVLRGSHRLLQKRGVKVWVLCGIY